MKYYCNGIEQGNDYFLMMLYNASATVEDIIDMVNGYCFIGSDGNIYEIEVERMAALKEIYNNINNGKKYGEIEKNVKYPFFWTVLIADEKYIYWRYYGESANDNTMDALAWILKSIFKLTPEEFIEKYECREV